MKKRFDFGKIALYGDRKINSVTVDVNLDETIPTKPVFTASAMVWNSKKTDCVMGGQCLDDILEYFKCNDTYQLIYEMWKKYHLNNLNAGTPEQEELIKQWTNEGNRYDYTNACKYLKSIGKYEVYWCGDKYKYGTGWIYSPIPKDDLAKIRLLFQ